MPEFLKCDALNCDHRQIVSGITADMVGMPCPLCGESLLTQSDFDHWIAIRTTVLALAELAGLTSEPIPDAPYKLSVGTHDGELTVKASPLQRPKP